MDINYLIDCIIIKKASILAFYYYYYNKEIKNIDDFLDDLFETKIEGYIINNLFEAFQNCMIKLLDKKYEKFRYNPKDLTTNKYIYLGELIYKLNNEETNINFGNYGSEANTLYCIDDPTDDILKLKNICYYRNILNNYLYYYKRLSDSVKENDKIKEYTIENIFEKIGYDIAIYIFVFISINYEKDFKGFSNNTKQRIISIFKKYFYKEFKLLFNKIIKNKIFISYISFIDYYKKLDNSTVLNLKDAYEKYNKKELSDEEDYLFEQKLYNMYKYETLNFEKCIDKNLIDINKFASFMNSVFIKTKNNTSRQKLGMSNVQSNEELKEKELKREKSKREVSEIKELKEKKLKREVSEIKELKREELKEKELKIKEQDLSQSLSSIKLTKIISSISDNSIVLTSVLKENDKEQLPLVYDVFKLFSGNYKSSQELKVKLKLDNKELFFVNFYWYLRQFKDYKYKFQEQFRVMLAKNTSLLTDGLKDVFKGDITSFKGFPNIFQIVLQQKTSELSKKDLMKFLTTTHDEIKKNIFKSVKTTNNTEELSKILLFLKKYLFFYNLLQNDILNKSKQANIKLQLRLGFMRMFKNKIFEIDRLYAFGFKKLTLLGNIESSQLVAELVNTTFQKRIVKPDVYVPSSVEILSSPKDIKLQTIIESSKPIKPSVSLFSVKRHLRQESKPIIISTPVETRMIETVGNIKKSLTITPKQISALESVITQPTLLLKEKEQLLSLIIKPEQQIALKRAILKPDVILPTSLKQSLELTINAVNMQKILDVAKKIFSHFEIMESNAIQLYIPKKNCEDPLIKYFMSENIKLFISKECINLIFQMLQTDIKNKKLMDYFGKLKLGYSTQMVSYKTKTEQLLLLEKQQISDNFIDIVNEGIKTKDLSEIVRANGSILNMFGTFLNTSQPKIKSFEPKLQEDIIKIFKFERYLLLDVYNLYLKESIARGNEVIKQRTLFKTLNEKFLMNRSLIKEEPEKKEPTTSKLLTPQQLYELQSSFTNTLTTNNQITYNFMQSQTNRMLNIGIQNKSALELRHSTMQQLPKEQETRSGLLTEKEIQTRGLWNLGRNVLKSTVSFTLSKAKNIL